MLHSIASLGTGMTRHSGVPGNTLHFLDVFLESYTLLAQSSRKVWKTFLAALGLCSLLSIVLPTVHAQQAEWLNPPAPANSANTIAPPQNAPNGSSPFDRPIGYIPPSPPMQGDTVETSSQSPPLTINKPANDWNGQRTLNIPDPALSSPKPAISTAIPPANAVATTVDEPQSAEDVAGELSQELSQKTEEAKNLLSLAIRGDRQAQQSLALDYLWPIAKFVLIMLMANWLGSWIGRLTNGAVSHHVDRTLGSFSGKLSHVGVLFVVTSVFYGSYMTSLGVVAGAVGFAIAMAFQGTLGNFASGVALLVFRPFKVGDFISVDGVTGSVAGIELFSTAVDAPDNRRIIIPNGSVFGSKIENWTYNELRRVDVSVGVSYSADMADTRRVLLAALQNIPQTDPATPPSVYLCDLGPSSVDWSCRVWCQPEYYLDVRERVVEAAKLALDKHGISIPFPQLDLHVVTPGTQKRLAA